VIGALVAARSSLGSDLIAACWTLWAVVWVGGAL
jgi:hypothetical protein